MKSYSVKNEPIQLTHNSHVILDRSHIAGIVQHIHKVPARSVKSEHIIYLFICTLLLSGIHLQRFESPKQHLPGAPVHHIDQSPVTHSHWLQLTTKLTYITRVIKETPRPCPATGPSQALFAYDCQGRTKSLLSRKIRSGKMETTKNPAHPCDAHGQ